LARLQTITSCADNRHDQEPLVRRAHKDEIHSLVHVVGIGCIVATPTEGCAVDSGLAKLIRHGALEPELS
jgi:hypothetical protein